jgi:hypothetical protein
MVYPHFPGGSKIACNRFCRRSFPYLSKPDCRIK